VEDGECPQPEWRKVCWYTRLSVVVRTFLDDTRSQLTYNGPSNLASLST
jgi:hypothetical protein